MKIALTILTAPCIIGVIIIGGIIFAIAIAAKHNAQFQQINEEALQLLNLKHWKYRDEIDTTVSLKSAKGVNDYSDIKFLKENRQSIDALQQ